MSSSPVHRIIDLNEEYELQYWTRELGMTAEEYKAVLKGSGLSEGVNDYLKKISMV
jgi:hypothetical protein